MTQGDDCTVCSGVQADIRTLMADNKEQWAAINALRNRLPHWATLLIGILCALCSALLTLAIQSARAAGP